MADETRVEVRFNEQAIARLLKSPAVEQDLARRAERVADAANSESSWGGYYSDSSSEGTRARARVWNVKAGAADDEARNNRMIRALDAGR